MSTLADTGNSPSYFFNLHKNEHIALIRIVSKMPKRGTKFLFYSGMAALV